MGYNINIKKQKEIEQLRKEGKTYQEIADYYGVTKQAIHGLVTHYERRKNKRDKEIDKIIYSGIYDMFVKDENLSMSKVCDIMGYCKCSVNTKKIRSFLYGETDSIRYTAINNILKYLNKTYDEVFALRK